MNFRTRQETTRQIRIIDARNDHCYVGSPGAATLDLIKKARKKVVCIEDSEDEEDDMSEISNLSREALIYLIRKQRILKLAPIPKPLKT